MKTEGSAKIWSRDKTTKGWPSVDVILPSGNVPISESAEQLFRLLAPTDTMFLRGSSIVEQSYVDGIPNLTLIHPDAFRSRVESFGNLFAWRTGANGESVLKPSRMNSDQAKALMAASPKELLPPIASIHNGPILIEKNGRPMVLGPGYHRECGGVLVANTIDLGDWEQISIKEASGRLSHLVDEMDFQTLADKSRAIAATLTPALVMGKLLTDRVPIDMAEADQSQAGKGYRHELVCALYNESAYFVTASNGGVGSTDESFSAALISGRPFICFDNFRGRMDSQKLESFLTAPSSFPARVPHRGEIQVDPRRFLLQFSSNGLQSTRDLANRASVVRIRKRPGFNYRDTLGEVRANPGFYLGAVFRIAAEWVRQGRPRTACARHDRREWAQSLDWIVHKLMGLPPLMDGHQEVQDRTSNPLWSWLRSVALAVQQTGKLEQWLSTSSLVEICDASQIPIPGGSNHEPESAARTIGSKLKQIFGPDSDGLKNQIMVEGFQVERRNGQFRKPSGDMDTRPEYRFAVSPQSEST